MKVIKGAVDKFPKLSFLCILVLYFVFGGSVPVIRFDALFYFVMGYYIVKYDLHFRDLEKFAKYIALAYILLIALVYVTRGTAVHGVADKLCIMTGLVFFAVVMTKVKNAGAEKLLLIVSRYSMGIYLFHEMNLTILRKIVQKVVPQNSITIFMEYFLIPCIIIVCCIVLWKVSAT